MSESPYQYPFTRLLTQRGIIPIDDIIINSDCVYEYGTNRLLLIRDIRIVQTDVIYLARYSDDRKELYTTNEKFPTKKIEQFPVEFNIGNIVKPLYPDPYTAGALFTYGDFTKEEIVLPLEKAPISDLICNKYNIEINEYGTTGLTWKKFFEDYEFYAKTKNPKDPLIPYEYMYASLFNRIQFIKGAFDAGYSPNDFPNGIGISHWDTNILKIIQKMLWSIGVLNKIYIGPEKSEIPYARYSLEVIGKYRHYPGFFYNINHMSKMINSDYTMQKNDPPEIVKITDLKPIPGSAGVYAQHIVLDNPDLVFLSENFLPRFSI